MSDLDKVLAAVIVNEGEDNPYKNKDNWSWFDYMIGYGCPLVMVFGVGLIFVILAGG